MGYAKLLESELGCSQVINNIEKKFDRFCERKSFEITTENRIMRTIKIFLHKELKTEVNLKGGKVPQRDCLSLSTVALILAARKGFDGVLARPNQLKRYLHAFVVLDSGSQYIISGKHTEFDPVFLSINQVINRLKLTRRVLDTLIYPLIKLGINY